jgi:hypothetical protein
MSEKLLLQIVTHHRQNPPLEQELSGDKYLKKSECKKGDEKDMKPP